MTFVVAIAGVAVCAVLARAARRAAAIARLRARPARWQLPVRPRSLIAVALVQADVDQPPEEVLEVWAAGVLAVLVVTMAVAPAMAPVSTGAAIAAGPIALWAARGRRERRFVRALPDALEQLAAELRGGGTVRAAIGRLAESGSAVAPDLHRVNRRTDLGMSLVDALRAWCAEHDLPGVRAVAGALAVASSVGGGAADAMDGLASSLCLRLDAADEARALSAQARLSAVVIGVAPLGYLVFSGIVDPRSVGVLVDTGVGRVCLVVGLGLEALAGLWIHRIVSWER
jgi:tight adherence protein B